MIRRAPKYRYSEANTFPGDSSATKFSPSPIKSNIAKGSNRHEQTNMTSYPPTIRYTIGHRSGGTEINNHSKVR